MRTSIARRLVLALTLVVAMPAAAAAAQGEMRWGLDVTLAPKWLDPAETEAFNTPFMMLYAVHDALVKPMPTGVSTPSLAESWTESEDHLSYTFTLRKNARFHNGLVHQIQKRIQEQVVNIPIYDLAFIWGVGPRVEESGAGLIPGFAYSAPFEDLRLKK